MLRKLSNTLWKYHLIRFGIVGVITTLADIAISNLLMLLLPISSDFLRVGVSKLFGFLIAALVGFCLHGHLTFRTKHPLRLKRFIIFAVVSGSGAGVNTLCALVLFALLKNILPFTLAANSAFIGATMVSMIWNYFGYRRIVFKKV